VGVAATVGTGVGVGVATGVGVGVGVGTGVSATVGVAVASGAAASGGFEQEQMVNTQIAARIAFMVSTFRMLSTKNASPKSIGTYES
jgi:hypothetical protein